MDLNQLEKYSSAITLSDMEIFVFPELMYSLVLANIMSPVLWRWRDIDCFKKLEGKTSQKKLMRLKQFIMDEYDFNLDLETWGLTDQVSELKRFAKYISPEDISSSNALFGYHGDAYYFDVDIRRHFGLDKYDSNVIPYWKTETLEAMEAFKHKDNYEKAAGECVSFAALYAAAAFVVCKIPLDDIYMILTPLHSQNFIDINGGILTNNRRIVTKGMWFNGTAISDKAQRALRNEQVTIVSHKTGFVHCFYEDATMAPASYEHFSESISDYLSVGLATLTLANFLRCHHEYQPSFQFCCSQCKRGAKYAKAEVLFHYEHGSNLRIADDTFEKLLEEVSDEDLSLYKFSDRICCNQFCAFIEYENLDLRKASDFSAIGDYLSPFIENVDKFLQELCSFLHVEPKLPNGAAFIDSFAIDLSVDQSRQEVIDYLKSIRATSITADLSFYVYRDMAYCDWQPFIKAAIERNPVCVELSGSMSLDEVYDWLCQMPNESIYDGYRLAQPDEVVNYGRGDGLEKSFLLAAVVHHRDDTCKIKISILATKVTLEISNGLQKSDKAQRYEFISSKDFERDIDLLDF